jgi:hypothetical protein
VITQRLRAAGVTTNQVQAMWLKQALASPQNYGAFPLHAQALQNDLANIVRIAKAKYPNLRLVYFSGRSHPWVNGPPGLNPEPFAYETGFAPKWLVEDQIRGRPNLNFDSTRGPVVAPWLSWGPYNWAAGTRPRSDGLVWNCEDFRSDDFTHPSASGVYKTATQLLAFFKTDPTTTPWFLKPTPTPPTVSLTASTTKGIAPLRVEFAASATGAQGAVTNYVWTFDDGCFSTEQNPTKLFPAPGVYTVHLVAEDNQGNVALSSVVVRVSPPPFEVSSVSRASNDLALTWTTRGGENYLVELTTNISGAFSNTFTTISPLIAAPPFAVSITNFIDPGAATSTVSRYYRIRLSP